MLPNFLTRPAIVLATVLALPLATPALSDSARTKIYIPGFGTAELVIETEDRSRLETDAKDYAENFMWDWSLPGHDGAHAMMAFYGDRVQFHGKSLSFDQVIDERYAFVDRWPDRDYRVDPHSIQADCRAVCEVWAEYDFSAYNPATGALSQGRSTLELTLMPKEGGFVIVRESGHVIQRY